MTKRRILGFVSLGAVVLWCLFIWHFSLSPAADSSVTSGEVTGTLNSFLEKININLEFSGQVIRKLAHFVEFFVLGLLLALTLYLHSFPHVTPFALAISVLVAAVDECLQFLSPGRAPSLTDVLLDSLGAVCGIAAFLLLHLLCLALLRRRKKNLQKNQKKA